MTKKDTSSTNASIKIEGSGNNIHVGHNLADAKKEKKPNWWIRITVTTVLGIVAALIIYFAKNAGRNPAELPPAYHNTK